jgi:hypothetical protein
MFLRLVKQIGKILKKDSRKYSKNFLKQRRFCSFPCLWAQWQNVNDCMLSNDF